MNVVLVEPEIPPNTGNVARLCAATRTTLHLVGPLGFKLDDKTLKRAGMDYWEQVTWKYWASLEELQNAECRMPSVQRPVPNAQCPVPNTLPAWYYVTTRSQRPYTAVMYGPDDYLVFGRETAGLPAELLAANADRTITIPMPNPQARSLNLATAVGIVLYHALWQTSGWEGAEAGSSHE